MPVNLLAICRSDNALVVKRVQTTGAVQAQLEGIFIQQENDFLAGITEEVQFDGGWTPDDNQLLYATGNKEVAAVMASAQMNLPALPQLDAANLSAEGVKALAVLVQRQGGPRLLLQLFTASQILQQRFTFLLDGDTFSRLTAPAFSLATKLAAIVDGDRLKFQSYSNIRRIFDLANLYKEASDAEVDQFCTIATISIADSVAFKGIADQGMRRLIHAISANGTLTTYTPEQISEAGLGQQFPVAVAEGRIVFPTNRKDAKALLHFLDNGLYRGALGGELFITNSKRRHTP